MFISAGAFWKLMILRDSGGDEQLPGT